MVVEKTGESWLHVLFFFSGFPALLYQIVWQRALLSIYGVNIESVTVVVSAFMLGLGLGSLAGGYLSRREAPLLVVFALMELSVAGFGLISLHLFYWAASFTAGTSAIKTGMISFALVLVPTILMGGTLPVLVAHRSRLSGNVGRSVGSLYFVNTLGSAVACFLAAEVTMRRLGLSGSVMLAAAINTLVAVAVLCMRRQSAGIAKPITQAMPSAGLIGLPLAIALAAATGFISLCYEIIWYRVYSFTTGGSPKSFAFVLGAFLMGIAFGSLLARRMCLDVSSVRPAAILQRIAALVLFANLAGFLTVPFVASAVKYVNYVLTLPLIAIAAGVLGAIFPLLCHIAVPADRRVGAGLSWLYLANIIGSALGSFVVGFMLMDIWTLREIVLALALMGTGVACAVWMAESSNPARRLVTLAASAGLCAAFLLASRPLFANAYERLQKKAAYRAGEQFTDIVETRSGVITVDPDRTISGGGAYDGMLITDITETDTVLRPYAISFFHPDPKDVLLIGLAGGAWAEVIANHPRVAHVTVVEINPGYFTVIRKYLEVAPVLSNPKIEMFVDDGRRWLVRYPDRKFDLIVMDTTYHWRAHATNVLSREFLDLARKHLNVGGVLYYNATHSGDVELTGVTQFPYAIRFGPLLAVSDSPMQTDKQRWRQVLTAYRLDGKPVFDCADEDDRARLDEVLAYADTLDSRAYDRAGMENAAHIRARNQGKRIVTDDNMASEWMR
jgi:predicted membrane-bound spermidine synthase